MSREKDEDCLPLDEEVDAENENEEILEVFSCKYCEFQSTSIDDLDEHIISHDEAILEDNYEEEVGEEETFERINNNPPKFSVTPLSFKDSKNAITNDIHCSEQTEKLTKQDLPAFYDEFKNIQEKRVFVCPYCGYQSMKKLDMHRHLKIHNEPVEVPVYACAECPYTTRRKCDMPKHLLTHCKGGNVPMYKCTHCPYATKRKGDLPRHMLCHKKPEVDSYQCHQCTYSSRRRGDLKRHQLSHEDDSGGVKATFQYNCTECGYISKRLNDLHKHVVLHCDKNVKGALKCTKCDYATEISNHFAKHVLSNCQMVDMARAIFAKDSETMQDYIVLDEDELHLYQLDKDSFPPVLRPTRKRRRSKDEDFTSSDHSDLECYYVKDNEGLRESKLPKEATDQDEGGKVLVLSGYEDNEKADCEAL